MKEQETAPVLRRADVDPDPIVEFTSWFEHARSAGLVEPTAASLSTADARGRPSGRMVLLKGVDARGFVFYTNYESRKGLELRANPWASLHLWWDRLERQVRIEGRVSELGAGESDAYFASRDRMSRIGAWASKQSRPLESRTELLGRFAKFELRYPANSVPRPPFWGGYRVSPSRMEFWSNRLHRLHDRRVFTRTTEGWKVERLFP